MSSTVDMSVIAHGAHDVVTAAIQRGREEHRNRSSARLSGAVLEALAAAGYVVVQTPPVGYKGPNDTDASAFLAVADRLDGNYPAGGSNVRRAVSILLRRVVAQLESGQS